MAVLAHSNRGFSAQSRIMVCGGSVIMTEGLPYTTNDAAELGTAVHEMVEFCTKFNTDCHHCIGLTFNNIVMTETEAEAGQVWVNYIRQLKLRFPNAQFWYELKVCMSSISNDLWGTSDFIMLNDNVLYSLDYKNGYELVEVDKPQEVTGFGTVHGNAQTVGYALAAMDTLKLWGRVDTIVTGIIQPNNDNHEDGIIRLKTYNIDEITTWHQAYRASHGRNDLVAGLHCKYCKAAGFCAVRIKRTFDLMGFTDSITRLNEDQIIEVFKELPVIKRTMEMVKEQAQLLARQGKPLKDYKLVRGIVKGYCTNEEEFVNEAIESYDGDDVESFKASLYNEPKLKGMTANKKIVAKELVDKYYRKPDAKLELVPITHRGAAVMPDQRPDATGKFGVVS